MSDAPPAEALPAEAAPSDVTADAPTNGDAPPAEG